jgi:hypothetical protein
LAIQLDNFPVCSADQIQGHQVFATMRRSFDDNMRDLFRDKIDNNMRRFSDRAISTTNLSLY